MYYGKIIREHRVAAGLTVEEVAKAAGMNVIKVRNIESNMQNVTLSTAVKLFDAMGYRLEILRNERERLQESK